MSRLNKISVLIPDGESALSMWVVMGLSQIKGLNIYIMSEINYSLVKKSKKVKGFYMRGDTDTDTWIKNIDSIVQKHFVDIVMPVSAEGIKKTLTNFENIPFKSKLSLLPKIDSFNISDNKGLLSKHLLKHEIPHPKTFLFKPYEKPNTIKDCFPVIMKPFESLGGGTDIFIFNNKKELESHFLLNTINYPYLIQDYINGYDIDCSVLCKKGEILAYTIQKGTIKSKDKFAPNIGVKLLFEQDLFDIVVKLMKSLCFSGVAHIDLRYDINKNEFKVIEINPRFWGSVDASIALGVNFPYLLCLTTLNKSFNLPMYRREEYLNLLGLSKRIKDNKLFVFKLKFILKNTPLKFFLKDRNPLISVIKLKIKNVFSRSKK